jgi:hypothetical protein
MLLTKKEKACFFLLCGEKHLKALRLSNLCFRFHQIRKDLCHGNRTGIFHPFQAIAVHV